MNEIEQKKLRESIIQRVTDYAVPGHPGKPLGHFLTLIEGTVIRDMVADGTLKMITIEKQSKVDPTRTTTYRYVALNS